MGNIFENIPNEEYANRRELWADPPMPIIKSQLEDELRREGFDILSIQKVYKALDRIGVQIVHNPPVGPI